MSPPTGHAADPGRAWIDRARRALLVAVALAAAALGLRIHQIHRASRELRTMEVVGLDVADLDGGFVVRPVRRGLRLARVDGPSRLLEDGDSFVAGSTRFTVHRPPRDTRWTTVLEEPLRVFAARETEDGPRGGYRRVDIGGDPLGSRDGTRDRIYVDHRRVARALPPEDRPAFEEHRSVARLLPARGEVFRLADESLRIQAEIPGLTVVRDGESVPLEPGAVAPLASGDRLVGPGVDLRVSIEQRWHSSPVSDGRGTIVAQRQRREPTLVVTAPVATGDDDTGRAWLSYTGRDGSPSTVGIPGDRPILLYGDDDRLGPLRGHVIPDDLDHEQLRAAFAEGIGCGAIQLRRGFLLLSDAEAGGARFAARIGPALHADLARLARRYNGAQDPATVAVRGTVGDIDLASPAGWTLLAPDGTRRAEVGLDGDGDVLVLPPPGDLLPELLAPHEQVRWRHARTLWVPDGARGAVVVTATLPVEVRVDGALEAAGADATLRVPLDLGPGRHELTLALRATGRPRRYGEVAGLRAAIDGADLLDAYGGARRFVGWRDTADRGRVWEPTHELAGGYHWIAAAAPVSRDDTGFLQLRFRVPEAGPTTLRLSLAGWLREAYLDGSPLPAEALPRLPGETAAIPVDLSPGTHLLAARIRQPAAAPDEARGGVRLQVAAGTITGLHPETERQVRVSTGRPGIRAPALMSRAATGKTELVVARGVGGLPPGTVWRPSGDGSGPSLLLVDQGRGRTWTALDLGDGVTVRYAGDASGGGVPFAVVNRSSRGLALWRQLDPLRRPYRPFGGFAVGAGRAEPFRNDRDAVRRGGTQVTYRTGAGGQLTARVQVLRDGVVHRLHVDGPATVVPPEPGSEEDLLVVSWAGDDPQLRAASPGTAVYRDGLLRATVSGPGDLPRTIRPGDALSCPSSGLLLVARRDDGSLETDGVASGSLEGLRPALSALSEGRVNRRRTAEVRLTIDPALQAAAADELGAQLALARTIRDDAGLDLPAGPEGLRGAVVVLDARTGAVLAAVSEGGDAGMAGAWGLAWTHPGSTFKIVTALAALESDDEVVRAMVRGRLPEGLGDAPAGSLRGATVPRASPGGGRWSDGRDDPHRVRSRLENFGGAPLPDGTDLPGALRLSSNVYFGYLALLLHRPLREGWSAAGIADPATRDALLPLAAMARRLGFGEVLDLVPTARGETARRHAPLVDEAGRPVASGDPLFAWTGRFPDGALDDPAMAACAVGQGDVNATPLQMARVAAAVATGGRLPRPYLVAGVDGRPRDPAAPEPLDLAPGATDTVIRGLRAVVRQGTAATTFTDNPYRERIWGKTGSSERADGSGGHATDSWFVGVIEPDEPDPTADDPARHEVAIACVMPGAGLGGTHAAEVVDRLMRHVARRYTWRPLAPPSADALAHR